jgi:hypothetical protein
VLPDGVFFFRIGDIFFPLLPTSSDFFNFEIIVATKTYEEERKKELLMTFGGKRNDDSVFWKKTKSRRGSSSYAGNSALE